MAVTSKTGADKEKPVILIVDDDEMNLAMAQAILEVKVKAEYLTASSGKQCLQILQNRMGKVDLILLDVAMPGMDGLETLAAIRKRDGWKSLQVIFLTAAADKNTIVRASQLGITDYVRKPFVAQDLIDRVERALVVRQMDDPEIQDLLKALEQMGS